MLLSPRAVPVEARLLFEGGASEVFPRPLFEDGAFPSPRFDRPTGRELLSTAISAEFTASAASWPGSEATTNSTPGVVAAEIRLPLAFDFANMSLSIDEITAESPSWGSPPEEEAVEVTDCAPGTTVVAGLERRTFDLASISLSIEDTMALEALLCSLVCIDLTGTAGIRV